MKKAICILIAALMLLAAFYIPAAAAENDAPNPVAGSIVSACAKKAGDEIRERIGSDAGIISKSLKADELKSSGIIDVKPVDEDELSASGTFTISDNTLAGICEEGGLTRTSGNTFRRAEAELVQQMDISGSDVKSLSGLEYFTGLQQLAFDDCSVTSITPLKSLSKLTYLSFSGNSVSSISDLSGLTSLAFLDASDNNISSLSAVSNMTDLEVLLAGNNAKLTSLPTLSKCRKLTVIDVSYCAITSCAQLSGLSNLTTAGFASNNLSGAFPSLSSMTSLELLDVGFNAITSISNMSKLTNLRILSIGCNGIEDISGLSSLNKLNILIAFNNSIASLEPLAGKKSINAIMVDTYKYSTEEINNFKANGVNIKSINNRNLIADLYPIIDCDGLEWFTASGNGIGDITPLITLPNLIIVDIENNCIDTVDPNNKNYLEMLQKATADGNEEANSDVQTQFVNLGILDDGDTFGSLYETPVFGVQDVAYRPATSPSVMYTKEGAKLSWTAAEQLTSPVKTTTGYQIFRSESASGKFRLVGSVTSKDIESYTDTTVQSGKTYYYRIRAYKDTSVRRCSAACTETLEYTHNTQAPSGILGDINGDKKVNTEDALIALKAAVGIVSLDAAQKAVADVNGDGAVNTEDALLILKYSVGIIRKFPA
ncbi:MAG: hypothetical protein IKS19_01885 [Clostridia bacterium]|nr:hypothetical protein [Clostridia bacterium]